jgi:hypothetical protein
MFRTALFAGLFAAGLISGASAATVKYHATLDTKSEVPPKSGPGTGEMNATLNTADKELTYTLTFQGLSGPATAAHFHGPADPGANAGVLVPIDGKSPKSPVHGTAKLTDAQIQELNSGKWYVNVHTAENPGGEIRGQVMEAKQAASKKR